MEDLDSSDICLPITDINLVLSWKCDNTCWIHKHDVVTLKNRSGYLNTGSVLDVRRKEDLYSEYKFSSSLVPRTIFCHDFKGGYLEDRFCTGSSNIDTYRFFNWAAIDLFIYFSHKLVTIPPQGWLNAGHIHGVPVLGTLITEWDEGETIWRSILTDIEKVNLFSQKLAQICAHYKFDGYLLNVENVIPKDYVPRLLQFVELLKAHLNLYCARQTWLIWYDSVTIDGSLEWQNKLCPLNKPFFDVCDGIFLNYVWKPADLQESLREAGTRRHDVFVGVDVWGRNCYQDGGFNVDKALTVLRTLNMSVAIFAPAWTFETLPEREEFLTRETSFWRRFSSYLHLHGPAHLPFFTNFCQGISFNKTTGLPLFNLGMQQSQPTLLGCSTDLTAADSCVSLYLQDGLEYNGACLKISACHATHSALFHRVFVCDFSSSEDMVSTLLITLAVKSLESDPASTFRIYFVLEDRISIQGNQSVSMKKRPKGYRASKSFGNLMVNGSLVDFTAEKQTLQTKIKVFPDEIGVVSSSSWCHIKFLVELNPGAVLTEILLLPAPKGSVLWGQLSVERSTISVNQQA
ncbi:cytosolic endo-beta-N-acetylglucosaminidase 1 [Homalodisca vitripennis]|uniref:cytosolic endo-beta-N-acetylglucosaminidase 1 n=1 Tax=Homalodisca vitripennis TaxID=197043 RepID=UPI001EEAC893|nr:cytosolic endo-beta-N-acetylglucosaminidase 1 [Homalodisca vitripennis]